MPKYTGINVVRRRLADGRVEVYRYHRATGRRLDGDPDSDEFRDAYIAAEIAAQTPAETAKPLSGIEEIARSYMRSPEWRQRIAASTKELREPLIEMAKTYFAEFTLRDWNNRRIRTEIFGWRDSLSATPSRADSAIDALSAMLSWAYDRALIDVNHALRVPHLSTPRPRAKKFWTADQETALIAKARPYVRRLYFFALYSLMRREDMAVLPWEHFDGRWIVYTPIKTNKSTGVEIHIPVHELPPFKTLMEEMPRNHEFVLSASRGGPLNYDNIGRALDTAKRDAFGGNANIDRTLHDIRRSGMQRLLEAGCTDAEVKSISGHRMGDGESAMGDYVERSRKLATNAYRKWWRAMQTPDAADVLQFKSR